MLRMIIHYDNQMNFLSPVLHLWYPGSQGRNILPSRLDTFGPVFEFDLLRSEFGFKFKDMSNEVGEDLGLEWYFKGYSRIDGPGLLDEIWCKADQPFIYPLQPKTTESIPASDYLQTLPFMDDCHIPDSGGLPNLIYCAGCRGNCDKCENSRMEEIRPGSIGKESRVPQCSKMEECFSLSIILMPTVPMLETTLATGKGSVMIKRSLKISLN